MFGHRLDTVGRERMGTEMLGHWNDTVDRQGGCTEMFGTGLTQEIIK